MSRAAERTIDLRRHAVAIVPGPRIGRAGLVGLATRRDVASIARHLKSVHHGVGVHDATCIMDAPEAFEAEFSA